MNLDVLSDSVPIGVLAAWYFAFALKHVFADFILQNQWIANGKEQSSGWQLPLLLHVAGHAVLTTLMVLAFAPHLWWLGLVDFAVHGAIDRSKSVLNTALGLTPERATYWWLIGIDQALHHAFGFILAVVLALA